MDAMILAAGRGERMRPLTDTTPKPLLKIGGKRLIECHLDNLEKAGFRHVVINHSWLGEQIPTALGDGSRYNLKISYSDENDRALETAGGICKALSLLQSDPILVVNGDIWTDYPFEHLPKNLDNLAHLILIPNPPHHLDGDFAIENGMVHEDGKVKHTFSGIGVYRKALFDGCNPNQPAALAPLLRQAMKRNKVSGEVYPGQWWDIGTPERLKELDKALSHG